MEDWRKDAQWDFLAYSQQGAQSPDGRSEHNFHWRHPYQGQCQQEEVSEGTGCESGKGLFRTLRKEIYAQRKETIERVFADAKEKHAMRYTHHRGLAAVTRWVRLKFAAMNLKKLANWSWEHSFFACFFSLFPRFLRETHALASWTHGFFDTLKMVSSFRTHHFFIDAEANQKFLPKGEMDWQNMIQ